MNLERREFLKLIGALAWTVVLGRTRLDKLTTPTPLPLLPVTPTQAPMASPTSSPNMEKDPKEKLERPKAKTLLEVLMASPRQEADRKRIERQKIDPEWKERVDPRLLRFYNFALFGYGETNEPGPEGFTPAGVIIGTYTIISYDSLTKRLYKLSIS